MARTRKIMRGALRVKGSPPQAAYADLEAPPVPATHHYGQAEIAHMMGDGPARPRDRKGRFVKTGVLTKLRRR